MSSRLSAAEQVKRDERLCADRARGWSWAMLAEKYGRTERQCQNIWKQRPRLELATDADPLGPFRELFESFQVAIADYAKLAETTENDNVRLGAINRRVDTQLRQFELMCGFGLAPGTLSETQLRDKLRAIVELLSEFELSEDQRGRLEAALAPRPAPEPLADYPRPVRTCRMTSCAATRPSLEQRVTQLEEEVARLRALVDRD